MISTKKIVKYKGVFIPFTRWLFWWYAKSRSTTFTFKEDKSEWDWFANRLSYDTLEEAVESFKTDKYKATIVWSE